MSIKTRIRFIYVSMALLVVAATALVALGAVAEPGRHAWLGFVPIAAAMAALAASLAQLRRAQAEGTDIPPDPGRWKVAAVGLLVLVVAAALGFYAYLTLSPPPPA